MKFQKNTIFQGRSKSPSICTGITAERWTATYPGVALIPHNTKGESKNCVIVIPNQNLKEFIELLQGLVENPSEK